MPRGKYVNHKGRNRHFTSPEELQQEDEETSSSESSEDEQPGGSGSLSLGEPKSSAPEEQMSKKGVAGLIKIENLNRTMQDTTSDVSKLQITDIPKAELSGGDRKQIRKQKARQRYEKLHAEGKTTQAKADLARLALIKKQRALAAAKREADSKKKTTNENKAIEKESEKPLPDN